MSEVCEQRHYAWQVRLSGTLLVNTLTALRYFDDIGVRGLLIHSGTYHPLPAEMVQRFLSRGIPIVAYDVTPTEYPVDWVGTDETAVGEIAVDYLYRLGHRRIAVLGDFSKGYNYGRPQAIYEALVRRGLPIDLFIEREFTDVRRELGSVLNSVDPPTALIGENDFFAIYAISVAQHLGISVPGQLSILGIGNYSYSPYTVPPLTTIAQPLEMVAKHAVELLFARIADPSPLQQGQVEQIALKPTLIERASCAKVR